MLWEVMRWETGLGDSSKADGFRLNNNFRSRYVRMLAKKPGLAVLFATRRLRTL